MFYISEIMNVAPATFKTALQQKVYEAFARLGIPFKRVETDEAITMEDCAAINEKLDMKMVKTLFLCNRQQTDFYLFITCGDKPFQTKAFSHALGIARVSFAPAEMMLDILSTPIGAATALSVLLDTASCVKVVFDNDVVQEEWYGCSDGTTTGYMKVRTADILNCFLNYTNRRPTVITV